MSNILHYQAENESIIEDRHKNDESGLTLKEHNWRQTFRKKSISTLEKFFSSLFAYIGINNQS